MPTYIAPVSDYLNILENILKVNSYTEVSSLNWIDRDVLTDFLSAAGRICEEVAQPLNQVGDIHGCQFDSGKVRTPPGFQEAYKSFANSGWVGLAFPQEHGGQGLPSVLAESFNEMLCAANMALSGFIELTEAVMTAIAEHADDALKARWLPGLIDGRYTGAMHLTEAHAGSDLGLVRTRAEPVEDGTYLISGQKIFITNAEHDLADNIVNLVLARLPDAPAGTRGLSLFLVPKFLPNADGSNGKRNKVECINLEHKMGLKAAPTGTYAFDSAKGWLVGKEGGGIDAMFSMVNDARLGVALQGLAIAEVSMQNATVYALDRLQGRAIGLSQASPPEPILNHPDVRRMILTMQAFTRPARALGLWVALQIDISRHHPDQGQARLADQLAALMTPVIKSVFSDRGFYCADQCIQVHGGHGFVRDTGVEQFIRDVRVTRIYEGTNAIQALDLVRRKIHLKPAVDHLFTLIHSRIAISQTSNDPEVAEWALALAESLAALRELISIFTGQDFNNDVASGANDFQDLFGLVVLGWMSLERLAAPLPTHDGLSEKDIARVFFRRMLPEASVFARRARLGCDDLLAMSSAAIAANAVRG